MVAFGAWLEWLGLGVARCTFGKKHFVLNGAGVNRMSESSGGSLSWVVKGGLNESSIKVDDGELSLNFTIILVEGVAAVDMVQRWT
jgi:hypothetical protein